MKGINIFFIVMLMCVLGIGLLSTMQGLYYTGQGQGGVASNTGEIAKDNLPENVDSGNYVENAPVENAPVENAPATESDVASDTSVDSFERSDGEVPFCGISTYKPCESDGDCVIAGCLNQVCQNKNDDEMDLECDPKDCYNSEKYGFYCKCFDSICKWG